MEIRNRCMHIIAFEFYAFNVELLCWCLLYGRYNNLNANELVQEFIPEFNRVG